MIMRTSDRLITQRSDTFAAYTTTLGLRRVVELHALDGDLQHVVAHLTRSEALDLAELLCDVVERLEVSS